MSTAHVVKKKGRPKKTVADTISIVEEPILVKAKKPRVSRKSTTPSPNKQPQKDLALAGAQVVTKHESLPSSPKAVKEPKTRPMKSVAAETVVLASRQVKSPSTRPEPSLILKEATAFVERQKDNSSPEKPEPVEVDPQTRPKEFKAAGTLPAVVATDATKATKPSRSSQPTTSPFLADFFTQPPLAEQPDWSRPKNSTTTSASSRTSPELAPAPGTAAPPRSNTSALLSASPLPTNPKARHQSSPETQAPQTVAMSAESPAGSSPGPSTRPQMEPKTPSVRPTSQAVMASTIPPTEATAPTPTSPPVQPSSTKVGGALPRLPPRGPAAVAALKPTDMPYEMLKRDPKFKALSRRYTALIVSIPILLATSYALYGRYTETTVQRRRSVGVGVDQGTRTINGGV